MSGLYSKTEDWKYKAEIKKHMIGLPNPLNLLAKELISHLGQESFYELM